MRFTFEGVDYSIGFERFRKLVTRYVDGKAVEKMSDHPYTTVSIYKVTTGADGKRLYTRVRMATVGPFKNVDPETGKVIYDTFYKEGGRLAALRSVSRTYGKAEKGFKQALWSAYLNRGRD
jgi:hypothetical protein